MNNVKVTAQVNVNGQVYVDTNQTARAANAADSNASTLISDNVVSKPRRAMARHIRMQIWLMRMLRLVLYSKHTKLDKLLGRICQ
ncbi:cytidine deaminase-like fold-containing protein [Chromobacterium sphagni]|uniref:cytidine deaminase-like fold-containing protein n=1 Tax=Chromobacterium sphagni TaxID=1903179 RepID=UPI003B8493AF